VHNDIIRRKEFKFPFVGGFDPSERETRNSFRLRSWQHPGFELRVSNIHLFIFLFFPLPNTPDRPIARIDGTAIDAMDN